MPRPVPKYSWGLTEGEPLKAEQHTHRMKGKSKGRGYKSDTIPASFPTKDKMCTPDVHFGSHRKLEIQIRDEMIKAGL
ncbi:hypothetical protein [Erwinia phage Pecta]|nr:hypothetical protein [Erwinia phage Pecta]